MTGTLVRRYLSEYARRPLNLALLVVVPVIFVAMSAGAIADFARILGGGAGVDQVEVATAGWAAAFLAGVSGFFHVAGSRDADRRLANAGATTIRVVAARVLSSTVLAALASGGALLALVVRADVADVPRAIGSTVMFGVIYLAIGITVGAWVRSEVNGSLVLVFVWMFDVFLGPAMGQADTLVTRVFPSHFPTLVMLDATTNHAGPLGDLGASMLWVVGSLLMALLALHGSTRPVRGVRQATPNTGWSRTWTGLRYAWKEYRRNLALWVLLAGLPLFFITLSIAVTPDTPAPAELVEGGRRVLQVLSMTDVHGAIMVAITVAFLAGLAGLFVVLGSAEGDRRLVLAGFRTREVLGARVGVIALAAGLVSVVSLGVTALSFEPRAWPTFAAATLIVALTYALIGVVIGPLVGSLGGLYVMFLLPFLDVGLAQNLMFSAAPPAWAMWMPAHGAVRVLIDGAFTDRFDEATGLFLALIWLIGLALAAGAVFRRGMSPKHA